MRLTHPLLLNAKAQDKPYKIRDRDAPYRHGRVESTALNLTMPCRALPNWQKPDAGQPKPLSRH
jgi:hypothetical protein